MSARSHSIDPGVTSHRASPTTTRHSHARRRDGRRRRHLGFFRRDLGFSAFPPAGSSRVRALRPRSAPRRRTERREHITRRRRAPLVPTGRAYIPAGRHSSPPAEGFFTLLLATKNRKPFAPIEPKTHHIHPPNTHSKQQTDVSPQVRETPNGSPWIPPQEALPTRQG